MRNLFTVTTANSDPLLTTAEARAAVGITDTSRDADLTRLVARISAAIYRASKVRTDGVHAPTLLSESVTETFRSTTFETCGLKSLLLSRRRISDIETITEGTTELVDADFEYDAASGELFRLGSSDVTVWPSGLITVEYIAGLIAPSDDLKLAAETWLRALWRDAYQTPATILDPFEKVVEIPGVIRRERWISAMTVNADMSLMPAEVESILYDGGYIETWVA
jgi:hypothetical protein